MKTIQRWVEALEDRAERKNRQFIIMDDINSDSPEPYLVRSIVFKSKLFCIYIHRFLKSDLVVPHDHPWTFFTWVIAGEYTELLYKIKNGITELNRYCSRKPGSIAKRGANNIHRVVVDEPLPIERKKEAVLTVCFIGPREQEWSFYKKDKVIPWTEFLNIDPSHSNWEGHE
jgi:hypothetical protein